MVDLQEFSKLKKEDMIDAYKNLLEELEDSNNEYQSLECECEDLQKELDYMNEKYINKEELEGEIRGEQLDEIIEDIEFNTDLQTRIFEQIKKSLIEAGYEFYALDEYSESDDVKLSLKDNTKIGDIIIGYLENLC